MSALFARERRDSLKFMETPGRRLLKTAAGNNSHTQVSRKERKRGRWLKRSENAGSTITVQIRKTHLGWSFFVLFCLFVFFFVCLFVCCFLNQQFHFINGTEIKTLNWRIVGDALNLIDYRKQQSTG